MQGEPQFSWPMRVYFEDTDAGGVVYYANYLKYMERARTEWLREQGYDHDMLAKNPGVVFVVRSVAADYLKPARLDDLLRVTVSIKAQTRSSVTFAQQVMRPRGAEDSELLATGEAKVVCVDVETFKPRPLPRRLGEQLKRY